MFFSDMARWANRGFVSSLDRDLLYRRPTPPAPQERAPVFLVGLSVGQGARPSGMAILERQKRGNAPATYTCCYLRRWPLATNYPSLQSYLERIFSDSRLTDPYLILEAGPSTRAILSFFRRQRLPAKMLAVEVKTSAEDRKVEGLWKVGKGTVIETARHVIQEHQLIFDEQMPPEVIKTTPTAQTVYQALATYTYNETAMVNEAFASRDGEYDDMVLAVALACWYGESSLRTFEMFC
jgi:hypothetical protein